MVFEKIMLVHTYKHTNVYDYVGIRYTTFIAISVTTHHILSLIIVSMPSSYPSNLVNTFVEPTRHVICIFNSLKGL